MDKISTISFPGLGIGEFQINAEAISFQIGSHPVRIAWYGILICFGILCAFAYFSYRSRKAGLSSDDVLDITLVTVLGGIVGARLYFLTFYGGFLETDGSFWQNVRGTLYNIVAIWNGGLAIYGGIIVGALMVFLMARRKKTSFFVLADAAAPGVMIAQAIGRWGNFCNGEAYGARVGEGYFLRMGLQNRKTKLDFGTAETVYVHPTFLYESLWNVLGFALINIFYKKRKFHGEAFFWYVGWYGFGRAFIELLRTDSLMIGPIRVSSMLSFLLVAAVLPMLIFLHKRYDRLVAAGIVEAGSITTLSVLLKKRDGAISAEGAAAPADVIAEVSAEVSAEKSAEVSAEAPAEETPTEEAEESADSSAEESAKTAEETDTTEASDASDAQTEKETDDGDNH